MDRTGEGSISHRTRSREALYFKNLHHQIKSNQIPKITTIHINSSNDDDVDVDDDDDDDDDDDVDDLLFCESSTKSNVSTLPIRSNSNFITSDSDSHLDDYSGSNDVQDDSTQLPNPKLDDHDVTNFDNTEKEEDAIFIDSDDQDGNSINIAQHPSSSFAFEWDEEITTTTKLATRNQSKLTTTRNNAQMGTNLDDLLPQDDAGYDEVIQKPAKRRRRMALGLLKNVVLDSILNYDNGTVQGLVSSSSDENIIDATAPHVDTWKFFYPPPLNDSTPSEESEDGEENKSMWMEFDFALTSSKIDSTTDSFMVDHEELTIPNIESDRNTLCGQGKHQFIINEEIGLICKYCFCVDLEMKYILPSFNIRDDRPGRKVQKKGYGETDRNIFNELQFQDSGSESQLHRHPNVHSEDDVWDLVPGIKSSMYQHQQEGFEFIWKNIAGGIDLHELKMRASNNCNVGGGCVISHAPGTGKTRLILAFLQAYMELYPTCKPVIIAPRSMLLTWEEQCKTWNFPMPFHNLYTNELSGEENPTILKLFREAKGHDGGTDTNRLQKIYSWVQGRSLLGVSYRLFENLVKGEEEEEVDGEKHCKTQSSVIRKILLEYPDLIVLDEGHIPRNSQSLIWKAVTKIKTEKRIILSGTPFQNNFTELYNTLCLVRPKFADTIIKKSRWYYGYQNKRGRKVSEAKGKWASMTDPIEKDIVGKVADGKLKELRSMIDPFVHVHKGSILEENLPGLRESVVVLKPRKLQKSLFKAFESENVVEQEHKMSLISTHPSLILAISSEKGKFSAAEDKLTKLRLDPKAGVKTKFLMELIRLSEVMNEKVLVFSQHIEPLVLIRDQLKFHLNWSEGEEVLYMDGQRDVKERQSSINIFNEETSNAKVLLASIRACSEGINLIGASRVVLLDVEWNPSVERQAISRAYRLGQKRVVYVYHLITAGTRELDKYCRQIGKERLSDMVFSSTSTSQKEKECSNVKTCVDSDDKVLEEMVQHKKLTGLFEKIIYQPKESNLLIETIDDIHNNGFATSCKDMFF